MTASAPRSIRAVPVTVHGTTFRSTLEADWAATLDALSIRWVYEPEAVLLPSGEEYRPDFYLPDCATWLEVKGPHDERLHKSRALAEATVHAPGCTGWPYATLELLASSPRRAARYFEIISAAPPGDVEVTIRTYRDARPGKSSHRSTTLDRHVVPGSEIRHRVRRRIHADRATCDAIDALGLTASPPGWEASVPLLCTCAPGPCVNAQAPWRLVVIGRPAAAGCTVFEGALDSAPPMLVLCGRCDRHSFTVDRGHSNSEDTYCRMCRGEGEDWAEASTFYGSAGAGEDAPPGDEMPVDDAPPTKLAETVLFVRAPRPPRRDARREAMRRAIRQTQAQVAQRRGAS
ncbi:hypothetical protein [Pseudonocardia alni]|uniref:hypothetical protein n=1 Tax=Pseudonocardia alni TaxID=33907 RepID=UPI0033265CD7